MSLPSSSAERPAAIAAADPPDEPPGERARSHGLFVVPKTGLYVCASAANVGVFVFPTTTAPAAGSGATGPASRSGTCPAGIWARDVARPRAVSNVSLIVIGTPWSGPPAP